jgi:hypothetical protein
MSETRTLPDAPLGWHRHPNGGGLVEDTATVDDTAYVGPAARVYYGNAGNARVSMSCCDNIMTSEDHDAMHAGQCSACGADVDSDGDCVEMDDCYYSPEDCDMCGYSPCDESC